MEARIDDSQADANLPLSFAVELNLKRDSANFEPDAGQRLIRRMNPRGNNVFCDGIRLGSRSVNRKRLFQQLEVHCSCRF